MRPPRLLDPACNPANNCGLLRNEKTVPSYSHSKLTSYQQCPQKYKFRYIDEIPPPIRSIELHLGTTVRGGFLQRLFGIFGHKEVQPPPKP